MSIPTEIKGFYTGCINSGNIGDDILYEIFILLLKKILSKKFKNVEVYKNSFKADALSWRDVSDIRIIGGGTLIHNYDNTYAVKINESNFSMAFGTGIIPDFSLNENNINSFLERSYDNINYIVNDTIKISLNNISNIKFGGLRGPISVSYLKKVNNHNFDSYMYDSGLLSNKFINFKNNTIEFDQEKKNIGINLVEVVGPQRFGVSDRETIKEYNDRIFNEIYEASVALLKTEKYNIIFFCMSRGSDLFLCRNMYNKIRDNHPELMDNVKNFSELNSFEDILNIISKCFFIIGERLHSNILAASVLTPFISISYSFKSVDFAESINLYELSIPTFTLTKDEILEKVDFIINNYNDIIKEMEYHIDLAYDKYVKELNSLIDSIFKKYQIVDVPDKAIIKYNTDNNCVGIFKINFI